MQKPGLKRLIVIGASAGGIEATGQLLANLPENLPAAVLVVIHISSDVPSVLPDIFQRATSLKVAKSVKEGELIRSGRVYIAPPNCHLLVEKKRLRLSHGPRENRHRPSIDPLFRSAAQEFGARAIGIILTGNLDDGAAGLEAIKSCGGFTIVQLPKDAEYPDMPRNALEQVKPDQAVPLQEIGPLLEQLTQEKPEIATSSRVPENVKLETKIAEMGAPLNDMKGLGKPSGFACPECHGVLWETTHRGHIHFRCRVGHTYSQDNLRAAMSEGVERALWTAVRALEEKISLLKRLSENARKQKHRFTHHHFRQRAEELEPAVLTLRSLLLKAPAQRP